MTDWQDHIEEDREWLEREQRRGEIEKEVIRERHRLKLQRKRIHQLDIYAEIAFRVIVEKASVSVNPVDIAHRAYKLANAMINERDEHIEETDDDE